MFSGRPTVQLKGKFHYCHHPALTTFYLPVSWLEMKVDHSNSPKNSPGSTTRTMRLHILLWHASKVCQPASGLA